MNQNFESKLLIIFLISIFIGVGFVFYLQNKAYAATCGNGVCEPGENCSNCSIDCGSCPTCGNGVCEPGENCSNCSIDCGPCGPTCGNGVCESGENPSNCCIDCYNAILPSVDLKANDSDGPVTVHYQDFISLSWTSQNASYCQASEDWSGSRPTSGTESIQLNSVKTYTFTLTCYSSSGQSASDLVTVIVLPKPPKVVTKPVVNTK